VIQWYNTSDTPQETHLELPRQVRSACLSDFLEERGEPVKVSGKS